MPIDPRLQRLLESAPFPSIAEIGVEQTRRRCTQVAAMRPRVAQLPRIEDRTVDGVGVRVYWPRTDIRGLPVVVYYHGGGFTIGNLDTHDNVARGIAARTGAIVVSVDYRLAPEHPYPAAVEDAFTALRWVGAHAAELGADPGRIAVVGDSAGGALATIVAMLARDEGGPALRFQLLWYPGTEVVQSAPSMSENAQAPVLNSSALDEFTRFYFGDRDLRTLGATAAPARAASHADLPPAYIATAQYDPLRDDGAHYAELLRAAGVPVEHRNHEDLVHGFVFYAPDVPAAAEAVDESLDALEAAL